MISLDDLDNRISITREENKVVKTKLAENTNRGFNAPYGLAGNKIADSISKVPIYNETNGSVLDAKVSVNPVNFHLSDKNFAERPTRRECVYRHAPNPYLFNGLKTDRYSIKKQKEPEIDSGFGLPKRKSIVLENPSAQAMNVRGQMTEAHMSLGIWRDEMVLGDTRLQAIITNGSGSSASATTPNTDDIPAEENTEVPPPPIKIPAPRAKRAIIPVVSQAFPTSGEESKEETILEETKEESKEEPASGKVDKQGMAEEMNNVLKDTDLTKSISDTDREKLDRILKTNGFEPVSKRIKKAQSYITAFNDIIDGRQTPKKVNWKEKLDKLKKAFNTPSKTPSPSLKIPPDYLKKLDDLMAEVEKKSPMTKRTPIKETKMFFEKERGEDR